MSCGRKNIVGISGKEVGVRGNTHVTEKEHSEWEDRN